jgi:transposase
MLEPLQFTCESGSRAGYDGAKRKKGSKVHMIVDTLGNLLDIVITPANEQERAQVEELSKRVQELTGNSVQVAFVDQGYTGDETAAAAKKYGIQLEIVRLPEARSGFVLLPRRWVVERSFGWVNQFRRLTRDYERLQETLKAMHFIAFTMLMLRHLPPFARKCITCSRHWAETT